MPPDTTQGFPLTSWTLGGFRSIRDKTTLELGGLNLLVGANSAGKSSIFHSLLMTAQTLGNPLVNRPLILNGHLDRLGLAEDIVHEESSRTMHIGFGLAAMPRRAYARDADVAHVRAAATFEMNSDRIDFSLADIQIDATPSDPETITQRFIAHRRTKTATREALRRAGLAGKEVEAAARFESYEVTGASLRVAGTRLRQFLPEYLLKVNNTYEYELLALQWFHPRLRSRPGISQHGQRVLRRPVLDLLRRYLAETYTSTEADAIPDAGTLTIEELAGRLSSSVWQDVRMVTASDWYTAHRKDLPFEGQLEHTGLPDPIKEGLDLARGWFQNSVRYLGPLRAAPQPLYNLPEAASSTSVGREGEYTAAVLSAYARRMFSVPDPNGEGSITLPLERAVSAWGEKLRLLSSVRSEERGKFGYELRLNVEGVDRDLDLTTVGVGVSQALPIVVLGLLAEPGSLLLFEQPELHLHPDVQAALGDFFLALARTGRQLIVETHSEYLVNRLRRREAREPDAGVADLVRLFFFERTGSTSDIQTAKIGPGGSMPNWPRGFLDTAAREVEEMVRPRDSE